MDLLRFHELDSGFIDLADKLTECAKLVVFTTESYHKHTCSIRMMNHVCKNLPCVLMVSAKLRASIVVRECYHLLDAGICCKLCLKLLLDVLHDSVHTSHCRDDPELIANAGTAVRTTIALECSLGLSRRDLCKIRLVCILKQSVKVGLQD